MITKQYTFCKNTKTKVCIKPITEVSIGWEGSGRNRSCRGKPLNSALDWNWGSVRHSRQMLSTPKSGGQLGGLAGGLGARDGQMGLQPLSQGLGGD